MLKSKRLLSVILSIALTLTILVGMMSTGTLAASAADNFMEISPSAGAANRYLQTVGSNAFNVFMYNNDFSGVFGDQHMAGLELAMHGYRIATNGDMKHLPTPEQWDATPAPAKGTKVFDTATNTITVPMTWNTGVGTIRYNLIASSTETGVNLKMVLTTDLTEDMMDKARFNLEFIPSKYRNRSYQTDGNGDGTFDTFGVFPFHPMDELKDTQRANLPTQAWYVKEWSEMRGPAQPLPFAKGYNWSLAPEDDLYNIKINSKSGELEMYDGRNRAQNGWFVLSNPLQSGKAGDVVVDWDITPTLQENWVKQPNIGFSQAGYIPTGTKFSVIELDKYDTDYVKTAQVIKVNADGSQEVAHTGTVAAPVAWRRYQRVVYNFSEVKETGMYFIRYGDQDTEVFPIDDSVYDFTWQSAISQFMVVQMDHIEVREADRVWHAPTHMDDGMTSRYTGRSWFDGATEGGTVMPQAMRDKGLVPDQVVEGLNKGGFFDAGDFDIQTARNTGVVRDLYRLSEGLDNLGDYDQVSVTWDDETGGVAEMHKPDGVPDSIQMFIHGVKWLKAQYDVFGLIGGYMELRTLRQYTHLGDPATDGDGYFYSPDLGENEIKEIDGKAYSGKYDDRVLLTVSSGGVANALSNLDSFAAAAYLAKDSEPKFAQECMDLSLSVWDSQRANQAAGTTEWAYLIQLILATDKFADDAALKGDTDTEALYRTRYTYFLNRFKGLATATNITAAQVVNRYDGLFILEHMDAAYKTLYDNAVATYEAGTFRTAFGQSGIFRTTSGDSTGWGSVTSAYSGGVSIGTLSNFYPQYDSFANYLFNAMNYVLGNHPVNNHSWVSGVGTKSFLHPYNSNRADEGFIPGSILPGHITFNPDYAESMDDFSFLWFENESIVNYQPPWAAAGYAATKAAKRYADANAATTITTKDFSKDYLMGIKTAADGEKYLSTTGFDVLQSDNEYTDAVGDTKNAGLQMIQSGVRIATNGDLRLLPTPATWDVTPAPSVTATSVSGSSLVADMSIPVASGSQPYKVTTTPEAGGVKVEVELPEAVPEALAGKLGFNLEFIPSEFTGKSFQVDSNSDNTYDAFGVFPLTPTADMEEYQPVATDQAWYVKDWNNERGIYQPKPIATGSKMTFAAEDDENRIRIKSDDAMMSLYDARNKELGGWFVLRTAFAAGQKKITWHISADVASSWVREPNIAHSQIGYEADGSKVAVIELDKSDTGVAQAYLDRADGDGKFTQVFQAALGAPKAWTRYNYRNFDFSSFTTPGIYRIRYNDATSDVFPITGGVYDKTWQASLSGFMAIQMDHVWVREGYKIWHKPSHIEDALQAPANTDWFNGWKVGAVNTGYDEYERIDGLNVGGWFNGGDFTVDTAKNMGVIQDLAMAYSEFGVNLDTVSVDLDANYVELHRPDGLNDIQQQVKHGIQLILGQLDNVGFVFPAVEVPTLRQYTHLGDGSSDTDGFLYDSSLEEGEKVGLRSGDLDDRMALADKKDSKLQLAAAASLAAADRVLKGFDNALAADCLTAAEAIWAEEVGSGADVWSAAIELYQATGKAAYLTSIQGLLSAKMTNAEIAKDGWKVVRVLSALTSANRTTVTTAMTNYKTYVDTSAADNPFGVPDNTGLSGNTTEVIDLGVRLAILHKYLPSVISAEYTYRIANYILGTHAYNSTSWVSNIGLRTAERGHGTNRADNYYVAGGVVSGAVNIGGDFVEAVDDYGYLKAETEYSIDSVAKWVLLASGASIFADNEVNYTADFTDEGGVTAKIENNTASALKGYAFAAIYNKNGVLMKIDARAFDLGNYSRWTDSFDLDLSAYPLSEGYYYNMFFMDENLVPITDAREKRAG